MNEKEGYPIRVVIQIRKLKFRRTAFVLASLSIVFGLIVSKVPGLINNGFVVGVSTEELNVVVTILVGVGLFVAGYIAVLAGLKKRREKPIDVDTIVELFRSFEEHEALQRERSRRWARVTKPDGKRQNQTDPVTDLG